MIKVSIIVPVYKAEKYIRNCIDSILSQSMDEFELILIDDGSPDQCPRICDEYAQKDRRVHVIHQINSGVSAARNAGIAISTGEYIGFVDADDTVDSEMYATMYDRSKEIDADIVMCDAITVFLNGKTEGDTILQLSESTLLYNKNWSPELLQEMAGAVWRCIYRRNLLERNQITFPEEVKISEDRIFNFKAMGYAKKVYYLKEMLYNRLVHDESCVMSFHADYYERMKNAYHFSLLAFDSAWDEEYQKVADIQLIEGMLNAVKNAVRPDSELTRKQKKEEIKRICSDMDTKKALAKYPNDDIVADLIARNKVWLLLSINTEFFKKYRFLYRKVKEYGVCGYIRRFVYKIKG